ncbi:hypothetical protein U472_07975 [Orenia metallireducens]|uniref:SpoIIAA-like n=1 Tax=Orenia metallireducens TaxID=1413210 RepID=A0A1C0AAS9_9FIRM|nr:hypothetical protein [Orenia metallireducens]OCL27386.1 hypothetical protein U472_07975 [Orenia metallireducens]
MKNYRVRYNDLENRIYITFTKALDLKEAKRYTQEVNELINRAKPNFTTCLDISCDPVHSKEVNDIFAKLRKNMIAKEVKGVATIISKSKVAELQIKRTLQVFEQHRIFSNELEAKKYLDSL